MLKFLNCNKKNSLEYLEIILNRRKFIQKNKTSFVKKAKNVLDGKIKYFEVKFPYSIDIDEVSDISVKEVLEELGETKIKKAGGGIAHMLGE